MAEAQESSIARYQPLALPEITRLEMLRNTKSHKS